MYKVERSSCSCHPETCSHRTWYLVNTNGRRVEWSDNYEYIANLCDSYSGFTLQVEENNKQEKQMTTLQLVEKLVETSPNVTIGFDNREISYVGINGVDYHLASIEDRDELNKVIDAIILLRQHGMA